MSYFFRFLVLFLAINESLKGECLSFAKVYERADTQSKVINLVDCESTPASLEKSAVHPGWQVLALPNGQKGFIREGVLPLKILDAPKDFVGPKQSSDQVCDGLCDEKKVQKTAAVPPTDKSIYPYLSPIDAAYKVMATNYQSCAVLSGDALVGPKESAGQFKGGSNTPIGSIRRDKKNGTYPPTNLCLDRLIDQDRALKNAPKGPLNYRLSVNFPFDKDSQELNTLGSSDCSRFISGAYAAAGLKLIPSEGPDFSMPTARFAKVIKDKGYTGCFEAPVYASKKHCASCSLKSGDLINLGYHHIVMVDQVGEDPLGVEKIKDLNSCATLSAKDFNFTFIHQSSLKQNNGEEVSGIHRAIANRDNLFTPMRIMLERMSRRICQQKFSNEKKGVRAEKQFADITEDKNGAKLSRHFNIIRHVGSKNPQCVMDKPTPLKKEECVKNCLKDVRRE